MEKKFVIARFHPQAWINNCAVDVDPEGEVTFDVTTLIEEMGKTEALKLKDDRDESDVLANSKYAPEWIRNWGGPFYIEIEDSVRAYFAEETST